LDPFKFNMDNEDIIVKYDLSITFYIFTYFRYY